jgi:aspartate/methionine/tyrosine aminotransferase
MDLFFKHKARIQKSNHIQEKAIKDVKRFLEGSKVFTDHVNQNIGNVFFIKVGPEYFNENDDHLFRFLFNEVRCGVLPGNVFGIPGNSGEVWFRITLLHDQCDTIIKYLGKIEDALSKRNAK